MTESSKLLTIEISNDCIAGCLDLVQGLGGDTENESIEEIISRILIMTIISLREDRVIKIYETDEEAKERIQSFFKVDEEEESEIKEFEEQLAKPLVAIPPTPVVPTEQPDVPKVKSQEDMEKLSFKDILEMKSSENDSLVQSSKDDSQKETALADLYNEIPRSLWGTERAKSMLEKILL